MEEKSITLSLNPSLFTIIEKISKIFGQSVEEYINNSIKFSIEFDIQYNHHLIGKCFKNLKQELEDAGIEVNFE